MLLNYSMLMGPLFGLMEASQQIDGPESLII